MDPTASSLAPTSGRPAWASLLEVAGVLAVVDVGLGISEWMGGGTVPGALVGWVAVLIGAALGFFALRREGRSWEAVGLGRPRRWWTTVLLGLLVAVGLVVVGGVILNGIVRPLLGGQAPDASRFDALRGHAGVLALALVSVWTSAAFGEEILVRGYLMRRLAELSSGAPAWGLAAVVSSVLFGLMHFYQGLAGMLITGVIGFLLALAYLGTRRNLWVVVIAHGLVDTLSMVSIYLSGRG